MGGLFQSALCPRQPHRAEQSRVRQRVRYQRAYNPLGARPALVGQKGSVRELVPIANKWGFYWGGHYSGRKDGMHFEVAVLKG